jgi:hypothetical protein
MEHDLPQVVVRQAEAPHDVGGEVLDHHIEVRHQPFDQLDGLRLLEIERDARLSGIAVDEDRAHRRRQRPGLPAERRQQADAIADFGRLDLDHLRPHVRQQTRAVPAGHGPGEVENLDTAQHAFLRLAHRPLPPGC